ncbi:MAG: glutathione S-transferase [Xanthomonadales bacterium]|nr:glutathione S-transferase [Xanthomonadales bacterium]
MKLYFSPGACSLAPMILAEWTGMSLDLERVDTRDPSPEFLDKNPLGAVPALELDNGVVRNQVDAILQYQCALAPDAGLDGAGNTDDQFEIHRWSAFLTGDFHPPFGVWFNPKRFTSDHGEESLAAIKQATAERIARVAAILDEQVGESGHVALGRRTFLDAYAFAMVRWIKNLQGGFTPYPHLDEFMQAMKGDDGVQRALSSERN